MPGDTESLVATATAYLQLMRRVDAEQLERIQQAPRVTMAFRGVPELLLTELLARHYRSVLAQQPALRVAI